MSAVTEDECQTVRILKSHVANKTGYEVLASICLDIIEDIRETSLSDFGITTLHELVDAVCKEGGVPLLDHLLVEVDCDICAAIRSRL